ncbi:hypothetical protein [Breznakiella homolactica]|uniref:DUF3887 domain-containing protein n=1 Tax=Breznakiella homolactica TaxID=2798577 RepID=A0A7T8B7M2_9SPIR|nr:hypothetical protein [Breznakiella homolactica]QQO07654.1 hypothetical protein JFL75_11930 [Breznakiella homolactica]
MSKNVLFLCIFFLATNGFLAAQNSEIKQYSDPINGYSGVAAAEYIDNYSDELSEYTDKEFDDLMQEYFEEMLGSDGKAIDKISKNNYWLCQQALNEWDLEDGELYLVVCADNMYSTDPFVFLIIIEDSGESFKWWGRAAAITYSE